MSGIVGSVVGAPEIPGQVHVGEQTGHAELSEEASWVIVPMRSSTWTQARWPARRA
jgi:hypothetical protein